MVATTLLEGANEAPGVEEHPGHDKDPAEFMHPWAREMYRRGFSFNGGERTKVFLNAGDELVDVSDVSNADSPLDGRALVAADLDDDGDADLFVHNIQRERHHLFRGELDPEEGTSFLSIDLASDAREPIGATVVVHPEGAARSAAQVFARGEGYASCRPARLLFGLADAKSARVTVRWPYGEVESFGAIPAGSRVVLREGAGEPEARERAAGARLANPLPPGLKLGLGERVPNLVFEDANGVRRLFDPAEVTKDGPVTIEVWASYCRPCIDKLPALRRRHADGERIVALSVDVPADRARAARLMEGTDVPSYFLTLDDEANEIGFDRVIDMMRLPIPTELEIHPGGVLGAVRTGTGE